jgi:hypothetical protein
MVLKRIGPLSCGRICAWIYAAFGLIVGFIMSIFALVGTVANFGSDGSGSVFGLIFGIGAVFILPIFYGIVGFLGGLISAGIYNLIARYSGGLEIELSQTGEGR